MLNCHFTTDCSTTQAAASNSMLLGWIRLTISANLLFKDCKLIYRKYYSHIMFIDTLIYNIWSHIEDRKILPYLLIFCNEYLSIDGKYSSTSESVDFGWCPFSQCGHCMWSWYHEAIVETLALSKGPRASWSYRRRHATVAEAPREGKGPDGRAAITQLNIPEIQSCGYHAAELGAADPNRRGPANTMCSFCYLFSNKYHLVFIRKDRQISNKRSENLEESWSVYWSAKTEDSMWTVNKKSYHMYNLWRLK